MSLGLVNCGVILSLRMPNSCKRADLSFDPPAKITPEREISPRKRDTLDWILAPGKFHQILLHSLELHASFLIRNSFYIMWMQLEYR